MNLVHISSKETPLPKIMWINFKNQRENIETEAYSPNFIFPFFGTPTSA
jgi:hypothetical protein